jgi:sugar phosphate isomerase/epimerase
MTVELGFVSFVRHPYRESVVQAAERGFDYVEILMDGSADREALASDADWIRSALADGDLDLLVHLPFPLTIASPHRHQREGAVRELEACIETAADLGARKGVLHASPGAWSAVWDPSDFDEGFLESAAELHAFSSERDLELCVENLFDGYLEADDFEFLFEETDLSATLDTGHAAITGVDETEMAALLADRGDRISHVHLNDNRRATDGGRYGDEHLPLGFGNVDFATVLEPVRAGEWSGTLSIELGTPNFDYVGPSRRHVEAQLD